MALLWIEGFEGFGTTVGNNPAPAGIVGRKYPVIKGEGSMKIATGRNGYALEILSSTDYVQSPNLTTNQTMTIGCAIKILKPLTIQPTSILVAFYDGAGLGVHARMNQDGTISVYRNVTLIGTSIKAMSTNTWYYLEMKVLCDQATNGQVTLKMNEEIWYQNLACDTQEWTNAYHTAFRIGACDTEIVYDDMYLLDGSGSINNDFLGTRKVSAIRPNAAGDDADWTPDSGDNHDRVNEVELDEDTSYVETGTTTDKDLYNYDPTVNMTSIDGIQIVTEVKATSGSMELQNVTKSGATEDAQSCGLIISTEYGTCSSLRELNPDTANPWTPAEIDAAQFGIKAI